MIFSKRRWNLKHLTHWLEDNCWANWLILHPIGLVTSAKQKGELLVRQAFQEAGGGKLTRVACDKSLSDGVREEAIKLFEEHVEFGQIEF